MRSCVSLAARGRSKTSSANTAILGEFDVPVLGIQVFHSRQVVSWDDTISWPEGRGGSTHLRQDLNAALDRPTPAGRAK